MFFFFPYSTDSPIYHFPVVTIGMIAVNVVLYVLTAMNPDFFFEYALQHGSGLHPFQWLAANFLHGGILHLVFNMISFWVFGLIVEGKIGWWRMILVCLGIGIVQNALIQMMMLWGEEGKSLGASSIVYGLMAISLLWAPRNDVNCVLVVFVFMFIRTAFFEVQVASLAGFLICLDLVTTMFTSFAMSTPLLHTAGAVVGGAVGLWMLKTNRVDCENWDLFSVWAGKHTMNDAELQALAEKDPAYQQQQRQRQLEARKGTINKIRVLVANGHPQEAYEFYRRKAVALDNWRLPEADLRSMIAMFHKLKQWGPSVPAMVELMHNSAEDSTAVRLKLAQILVQAENRPGQAWNVFSKVNPAILDPEQRKFYERLKQVILKAREENPYDIVDADW